ncbi:MAG TPA: hypothetical protein VFC80_01690 [Sphaerochaeta sp.]|nr:hypothetical protein [Sphaerochaeta sp.]
MQTDDATTVSATISISDPEGNLGLVEQGKSPSVLLSYMVIDQPLETNDTRISAIRSAFKKEYQRSSFIGAQIPITKQTPILEKEDGDEPYRLYALSAATMKGPPHYHATADTPNNPNATITLSSSKIAGTEDNTVISLQVTSGGYTIHQSELYRYNGAPFTVSGVGEGYPDYLLFDPPWENRYIHVFAALNVSDGDFTNIYWSDLVFIGSIEL